MEPWEIIRDEELRNFEVRQTQLDARYANANCRADILERRQDCDTRCQPKPPTNGITPAGFRDRFKPPTFKTLPQIDFTVKSSPDMIKSSWAELKKAAAIRLSAPLTATEKARFLNLEQFRLDEVYCASDWSDNTTQQGLRFDRAIYDDLLSTICERLISVPHRLRHTPGNYERYDGEDRALIAQGPNHTIAACMLRFLYVEDLDVCQEIQEIAASGVFVQSVEGRWVWPEALITTPRRRKARDLIQWVRTSFIMTPLTSRSCMLLVKPILSNKVNVTASNSAMVGTTSGSTLKTASCPSVLF